MPPVKARAVLLAAEIVGGDEQLAAQLHARGEDIESWLAARVPLPEHMYQQCLNIVVTGLLEEFMQRQTDLCIKRQASLG
jgi:hypothetical protein